MYTVKLTGAGSKSVTHDKGVPCLSVHVAFEALQFANRFALVILMEVPLIPGGPGIPIVPLIPGIPISPRDPGIPIVPLNPCGPTGPGGPSGP